jgi:hypothetical protein
VDSDGIWAGPGDAASESITRRSSCPARGRHWASQSRPRRRGVRACQSRHGQVARPVDGIRPVSRPAQATRIRVGGTWEARPITAVTVGLAAVAVTGAAARRSDGSDRRGSRPQVVARRLSESRPGCRPGIHRPAPGSLSRARRAGRHPPAHQGLLRGRGRAGTHAGAAGAPAHGVRSRFGPPARPGQSESAIRVGNPSRTKRSEAAEPPGSRPAGACLATRTDSDVRHQQPRPAWPAVTGFKFLVVRCPTPSPDSDSLPKKQGTPLAPEPPCLAGDRGWHPDSGPAGDEPGAPGPPRRPGTGLLPPARAGLAPRGGSRPRRRRPGGFPRIPSRGGGPRPLASGRVPRARAGLGSGRRQGRRRRAVQAAMEAAAGGVARRRARGLAGRPGGVSLACGEWEEAAVIGVVRRTGSHSSCA